MSALVALDTLLAARTLWHAGRSAAIAADGEPTGHAALDALLPQGGWPRRALTELLLPADGVGELSLLLPTLSRATQDGARVVLVAPPYLPYAPAWQAAGVDLSQLCIVEAGARDALWAFEQCLRSGACAAVLGWPQQADARALRRLQVAADSGQCLGFALRDRRHLANPSPAALRLEAVRAEQDIAWQVRKCRGGPVPAMPFVAGIGKDPSHLAGEISARRALDTPSPASGGGLGWGPASRDANPGASGAPPSAFGTFPRERGKEKTVSGTHQDPSHLASEISARRALDTPSPASGGGLGWGPASDANPGASSAPPSAFGTFPRERGKEKTVSGTHQDPSHLASEISARRALDTPSPASGGGLGWGPASRDANPRASGAPPSAFGTFPRERGKEKTVSGTHHDSSHLASEISARRVLDTPSPASGGGLGWGPASDANPRASGAPPSAFGTFPRERGKEKTVPGTHQDPSHLAEGVPPRRAANAPSPASGGGLGWGPASRDANPGASGAPPSTFGTFPREREKEKAAPDAVRVASQEACHVASLRPLLLPGNVVPLPATASAHAPGQEPEWRQEPMGNALLATKGSRAAPPRTFAAATRRASTHPQHELQFGPAPLARD